MRYIARDVLAVLLAIRHPQTPWYAKALAAAVVAYALSPIDLIPDIIPVLGLLDDLVLVPVGLLLARKRIPPDVFAVCRQRAEKVVSITSRWKWVGCLLIALLRLLCLFGLGVLIYRLAG